MAAGAASYATQAEGFANEAETSKDAAAVSESNALTYKNAAAASAAEAQAAVGNIALLPGFYNLKADTTSRNVAVTADYAVLRNSVGTIKTLLDINIDLDVTIGTTLLDDNVTVAANDTWYKVWLIHDPTTQTKQLILSVDSATAPVLPDGYTHYVFVMCTRGTGGSLYHLIKRDKTVQYVVDGTVLATMRLMATGSLGTYSLTAPAWESIPVIDFIPSTVTNTIDLLMISDYKNRNVSIAILAPNTNYRGINESTGNVPIDYLSAAHVDYKRSSFLLENDYIYVASSASGFALYCLGWIDNL
jgi:hypothetical protein